MSKVPPVDSPLKSIIAELGVEPGMANPPRVPRSLVLEWMQTTDIEALGALYAFVTDGRHHHRIDPPLSFDDYHRFVMRYFERCLRENPKGEWSDSRYSAGRDLVGWFSGLWSDPAVPRAALAELKGWLASLYRSADEELRTCLVTAPLEHLFENKAIAKYFADWLQDSTLARAYEDGMDWIRGGGRSPLGKPIPPSGKNE